jgi:hypothetical protein
MPVVVDTNVGVVSNGNADHVCLSCQLSCIERLLSICRNEVICIDEIGLIFDEYKKHFSFSGQPGTGDMFFKFVHNNQYSTERVLRTGINPCEDSNRGFDELPSNMLDPDDRKFLAVAVATGAKVVNAVDPGWNEQKPLTDSLDVTVEQLCPEYGIQ